LWHKTKQLRTPNAQSQSQKKIKAKPIVANPFPKNKNQGNAQPLATLALKTIENC
jgi:hypothetical protein